MASIGLAQIDTLQLVEIGSIQAPSEITNLYVEDLDGDGLKEIILTKASNVLIYNGITYEPIWTSPDLDHPRDLHFADINNDGFVDFSEKDTTNIRLFDPHNDATIWVSPALDSTYKCYTIGDRNADDWMDVAMVSEEPFTREDDPDNLDTAYVTIYDGPGFENESRLIFLLPNYRYDQGYEHRLHSDVPSRILFGSVLDPPCRQEILYIFTNLNEGAWSYNFSYEKISGGLWIISSSNLEVEYADESGRLYFADFGCVDDSLRLYVLAGISEYFNAMWDNWYDISKNLSTFSADTLVNSYSLWETDDLADWKGFTVGEINSAHIGEELAYGAGDSLQLFSFPETGDIWTVYNGSDVSGINYAYSCAEIFASPQLVCRVGQDPIEYRFFSGYDGSLSSVLTNVYFPISYVSDIEGDGNDEIMALDGANLYVYGLQRTAVDDELPLADRPLLFSNYPNPFNSSTTIEYSLSKAGEVSIEIFDLLGRKIETLVDGRQDAGTYRVTWNAEDQSSGVYFYRIKAAEYEQRKRMVLLK